MRAFSFIAFVLLSGCVTTVPVRFTVPAQAATTDALRQVLEQYGAEVSRNVAYTQWSMPTMIHGGEGVATRYRIEVLEGNGPERDIRVALETRVCDSETWRIGPPDVSECRRHLGDHARIRQVALIYYGESLRDDLLALVSE